MNMDYKILVSLIKAPVFRWRKLTAFLVSFPNNQSSNVICHAVCKTFQVTWWSCSKARRKKQFSLTKPPMMNECRYAFYRVLDRSTIDVWPSTIDFSFAHKLLSFSDGISAVEKYLSSALITYWPPVRVNY